VADSSVSPATLRLDLEPSRLRHTSWKQHAIRFAFGGLATALAGLLGNQYGPAIGGLFLAFPAILPASLSIVKQHEGKRAAGQEAGGAVPGSIGLIAFGATVWAADGRVHPAYVLALATVAWFLVGIAALALLLRLKPPAGTNVE
jgi:hypothetical protein